MSPGLERLGVLAAFTERTGGVSPAPFDSLNLGYGTGDHAGRVVRNRTMVVSALGISAFATGEQVHGDRVARIGAKRAGRGFTRATDAIPATDALSVTRPGMPVAIVVADCVPLVLAAPGLLVAVHAGWRGLAAGIVDRAVALFGEGRRPAAAIGPAIGPCHYEVGRDVALAVTAGSPAGGRVERRAGRTFLDLPGTVTGILRAAGISSVDRAGECTACLRDRFFSHRRDGRTGRQAAVAMLM